MMKVRVLINVKCMIDTVSQLLRTLYTSVCVLHDHDNIDKAGHLYLTDPRRP
jgi:hypothetical protein